MERFGYTRAGLRSVVEIDAPHLVMQTHPTEVAAVITGALAELAGESGAADSAGAEAEDRIAS